MYNLALFEMKGKNMKTTICSIKSLLKLNLFRLFTNGRVTSISTSGVPHTSGPPCKRQLTVLKEPDLRGSAVAERRHLGTNTPTNIKNNGPSLVNTN